MYRIAIFFGFVVLLLMCAVKVHAANKDDDLLLENPTFGKNQWFYLGQDYLSIRHSYETTTATRKGDVVNVWMRQDPYHNAEHMLVTGEVKAWNWVIDCKNNVATISQKWVIDSSNYAWKSETTDPAAKLRFNDRSFQRAVCNRVN